MSDQKEGKISDVIKKIVSTGVGAAFMTEDTVKNLLGDLPLPKDIIQGLVQNAKGAKEDFIKGLHEEVRRHLSNVDPSAVIHEILEDYDFEIKAKVSFKKKKKGKKETSE